jgi:hypothetical protein
VGRSLWSGGDVSAVEQHPAANGSAETLKVQQLGTRIGDLAFGDRAAAVAGLCSAKCRSLVANCYLI